MNTISIDTTKRRTATRAAFFIAGFAMGAWAPLVPYARQRLALDEKSLGALLLCLGLGSLITMLFSGKLVGRFGCRSMATCGVIGVIITLPFLAAVNSLPLMIVTLFLFGAGVGMTDITVNVQGTLVEKAAQRPLMSGFHGLFSVGGIVGAALGSLALSAGLTPVSMALGASLVILFTLIVSYGGLLPFGQHETTTHHPFRLNRSLVVMALMCLVCFLAEGSILDWSGIWLTSHQGLDLAYAGWGYAVFGCTMAIMRLIGDKILVALGRRKLLLLSGGFTITGFVIAVTFSQWEISLAAFALIGLGAANVVPIITTLAGSDSTMPANMSVAFVSTVGYLGILMGPALIGFVAHTASLAIAFIGVAVALVIVIYGAVTLPISNPSRK